MDYNKIYSWGIAYIPVGTMLILSMFSVVIPVLQYTNFYTSDYKINATWALLCWIIMLICFAWFCIIYEIRQLKTKI